jgi:hypothetical protein
MPILLFIGCAIATVQVHSANKKKQEEYEAKIARGELANELRFYG